jgi:hypothetical protein
MNSLVPSMITLFSSKAFNDTPLLAWISGPILHLLIYRNPRSFFFRGSEGNKSTSTSVVGLVRSGKAEWLRGKIIGYDENGIRFYPSPYCRPGVDDKLIQGDLCIMATGFERPSLGFLPEAVFQKPYNPPYWYLDAFPPERMEICAINCLTDTMTLFNAYCIGLYTRFLLMLAMDPLARTSQKWTKRCVDIKRWIEPSPPR